MIISGEQSVRWVAGQLLIIKVCGSIPKSVCEEYKGMHRASVLKTKLNAHF